MKLFQFQKERDARLSKYMIRFSGKLPDVMKKIKALKEYYGANTRLKDAIEQEILLKC